MDSGRLPTTVGYLLAQVCKAHYSRARTLLDEVGLYRGQQFVLCTLWDKEGITQSELADVLQVHPATVTNALKRMDRSGFVERRNDPQDQRVSRVYLTDAGREIRGAVEGIWAELEEQTMAGFSQDERETLEHLLQRVCENLQGKGA